MGSAMNFMWEGVGFLVDFGIRLLVVWKDDSVCKDDSMAFTGR